MTVSAVSSTTTTTTSTAKKDDAGSSDRFLKLLVAQMQNQDPLNPMDNAQVTSQMAQINTVNGIEKLNTTVENLSGQFTQLQAMQSTSLVGRDVVVPGNRLDINDGIGQGGFQLDSAADNVKIEILSSGGVVLDTMNLGAQSSGMSSFNWPAGKNTNDNNLSFRVIALSGANPVSNTTLMRDRVDAVSTAGSTINLQLQNSGQVAYGDVLAFN
ncbi:MAG: flagellar hook assembly protein FlgD [Rhizobacter sp.]